MGALEDYTRQAIGQGLLFNFGDELEAQWKSATGGESYDKELSKVRQKIRTFEENNRWGALTAELVGSLGTGVAGFGLKRIPKLGKKIAKYLPPVSQQSFSRLVGTGAGMGALAGAGSGEDSDTRWKNAMTGAATGGGLTAGLSVGGKFAGAIGDAFSPADEQARKAIREAIAADNLDPNQLRQAIRGRYDPNIQKNWLSPEIHRSNNLQNLTVAAARVPGKNLPVVDSLVSHLKDKGRQRAMTELQQASGTSLQAKQVMDQLKAQRKAQADPLYEKAFAFPGSVIDSTNMQRFTELADSPAFQEAYKKAVTEMRDLRAADTSGKIHFNYVPIDPADKALIKQYGKLMIEEDGQKFFVEPSIQILDRVKQSLFDLGSSQYRQGDATKGKIFSNLRTSLVDFLENSPKVPPEYKQARQIYADYAEEMGAIDLGKSLAKLDVDKGLDVINSIKQSDPRMLDAAKEGYMDSLKNTMMNTSDESSASLKAFINNPRKQEFLESIFGPNDSEDIVRVLKESADDLDLAKRLESAKKSATPDGKADTSPIQEAGAVLQGMSGNLGSGMSFGARAMMAMNPKRRAAVSEQILSRVKDISESPLSPSSLNPRYEDPLSEIYDMNVMGRVFPNMDRTQLYDKLKNLNPVRPATTGSVVIRDTTTPSEQDLSAEEGGPSTNVQFPELNPYAF